MTTFFQDLHFALRVLRRDRWFTVTTVLILGLGIGANTAVFSIVDSVLLRPLAYRDPDRLFSVAEIVPQLSHLAPVFAVNARHFMEWKRRCASFEDVALVDRAEFNLTSSGDPERLKAARVTANFFSVLGVPTRLGRTFLPEEGEVGRGNVVVLSDVLWRRRFGASPALVGQTIGLDGVPHLVVGILPAGFRHYVHPHVGQKTKTNVDVFKPWAIKEDAWGWLGDFNYAAVARLRPAVAPDRATAELDVIQAQIAERFEDSKKLDLRSRLIPLHELVVETGRGGLVLLLGAVASVLLVACVNLGNLMLIRATGRSRETALRAALGAPRWRILRGVLLESLVFALAGAALGIALSFALLQLFATAAPVDLPRADEVRMEGRALLFAVGLSMLAALAFNLFPAWRLTRADPQDALRANTRSFTQGGQSLRLRAVLVGVEVCLSVTLLIVAGLLVASFIRLDAVQPGFDASNVLTAQVSLPATRYPDAEKRRQFYAEWIRRLEAQPGVVAAGIISVLPLLGQTWTDVVTVEGDTRPIAERPIIPYRPITSRYFEAMGIRLVAGRTIEDRDHPRKVAVVSERAAERIWPGQNAAGKLFRRADPKQPPFEVVGVVGDVRGASLLKEPDPIVYVPLWERAPAAGSIAVRTISDPRAGIGALRQTLMEVDAQLALSDVQTMTQIESSSVAQRRFQMQLITAFSAAALLLAALGTYSVLAYSVARRTNEIGIRMALGAARRDVIGMVIVQGLTPVAVGLGAGLGAALALGRLLSGFLFEVTPTDSSTFATVAAVTIVAAFPACWIPASRAARVSPMDALRYE